MEELNDRIRGNWPASPVEQPAVEDEKPAVEAEQPVVEAAVELKQKRQNFYKLFASSRISELKLDLVKLKDFVRMKWEQRGGR